ncbi:YbaB/EbfC family nucleoid-associated protein [Haloechinothrix salitolerans]|uniref:YbaB/EbfC family nucleoid-associated protein n=1 Tax=Haloechinothrix salitolerans TaxID=926830 RepID=A0ABW2BXM9_9PSEU
MQPGFDDAQRWVTDYTRRVEDIQRRAEQVQEQINSARAQASSADGSVSVVLAPGGRLEKLDLSAEAMRLGHERLADTITQTVQSAHANAAAQTQEALRPLVGESDAMDFLREQINASFAPADDDAESARHRRDDDDFDDDDEGFNRPFTR